MLDLIKNFGESTRINVNSGKLDSCGMITPLSIVNDMVNLFIDKLDTKPIWKYKFLDFLCKSGNFLAVIYDRLMHNKDMIKQFPDEVYRSEWILNNQLYGVALHETDVYVASVMLHKLYGESVNIKVISNWKKCITEERLKDVKEALEGAFGDMKFDVIIGNPPYNNDMYLDFVQKAKQLNPEKICMITPAKWQDKAGDKNEAFRIEIVPYMSDVVMYKDSTEVFNIEEWGGVSYFLIDREIHKEKKVLNICSKNSTLASGNEIHTEDRLVLAPNRIKLLLDKLKAGKRLSDETNFSRFTYTDETERGHAFIEGAENIPVVQGTKYTGGYLLKSELKTVDKLDKYKVITSCMWGNGNATFDKSNKVIGVTNMSIVKPNEVPMEASLYSDILIQRKNVNHSLVTCTVR